MAATTVFVSDATHPRHVMVSEANTTGLLEENIRSARLLRLDRRKKRKAEENSAGTSEDVKRWISGIDGEEMSEGEKEKQNKIRIPGIARNRNNKGEGKVAGDDVIYVKIRLAGVVENVGWADEFDSEE